MAKLFITLASLSGMLAVILGAFGAHGLRGKLDDYAMGVFETAVQYHTSHALGLLAIGIVAHWRPHSIQLKWAGWLFLAGIVLFSGSLYVLAVSGVRWLGAITPLGGVAFIAGWICLALAAVRPSQL